MKKLILKTAFVTLAVVLVLAVAVFGIASLLAPAAMMRFTASLGMDGISGDYAYQEYERSQDIGYLARSFLIAADIGNDRTADERFTLLYEREDFSDFCKEQDEALGDGTNYRAYVCGVAAEVKYLSASGEGEEDGAITFALSETEESFPAGNPAVALAVTAAKKGDGAFCARLAAALEAGGFEENSDYRNILKILEDAV